MKKLLYVELNGALADDITDINQLSLRPQVFYWLGKIVRDIDCELALLINPALSAEVKEFIIKIFAGENIHFAQVLDISGKGNGIPADKEGLVIGVKQAAKDFAANIGGRYLQLAGPVTPDSFKDWESIYNHLKGGTRKAVHQRKTKETEINIKLNLDGTGIASIATGLNFLDHMLDQIARHGSVDLEVVAKGDLHIDEHHTMEDTAITLGEAFAIALGDKRGIERYGFCLPMDDALAQVAIDFGGRNWIEWDAEFKREKIGDVPTEMFFHFFKSFTDAAKCNLNVKAEGTNEHHKIEAIFKAFAKAIKMALKRDMANMQLPTTKGVL